MKILILMNVCNGDFYFKKVEDNYDYEEILEDFADVQSECCYVIVSTKKYKQILKKMNEVIK